MSENSSPAQLPLRELSAADDLLSSVGVMRILRPHLERNDDLVVERLKRQMREGYRLLVIERDGRAVALAGFRLQENTVFGRFAYIDDLVVSEEVRRQGFAERLLGAVREIAAADGRRIVALDTALDNEAARRVYHRSGYETVAYHLIQHLPAD